LTLLQFDFTSVLISEKIGKKNEKNALAYAAEQPLFLDSFLKLKIRSL
jgi:hypothetical protein